MGKLYLHTMGKLYEVLAIASGTEQANALIEESMKEGNIPLGVIGTKDGQIYLSRMNDLGLPFVIGA